MSGPATDREAEEQARAFDLRHVPDEFYEDPFPTYHLLRRWLRRWDPVHRCPDGSYFLTRHDDVVRVYQDHARFSSDKHVEFAPKFGESPLYEHHTTSVVFRDPPDHTRLRRLFAPAFTPRALAALEPRIAALVDRLLDAAARRGGMDVVEDYAGHETTTNLIGNGVVALLEHPGELARLRASPDLIGSAVEELLRFQGPNQLGNRRAVADAEIGGVRMPAGILVTLGIGAANRNPAQFPDPHRLDLGRTPNRHLAFIVGIHACAGMCLARMEGRVAIGRLVARFPHLRAAGPPVRTRRARFRALVSFPVLV